jgi:hypothetical protein
MQIKAPSAGVGPKWSELVSSEGRASGRKHRRTTLAAPTPLCGPHQTLLQPLACNIDAGPTVTNAALQPAGPHPATLQPQGQRPQRGKGSTGRAGLAAFTPHTTGRPGTHKVRGLPASYIRPWELGPSQPGAGRGGAGAGGWPGSSHTTVRTQQVPHIQLVMIRTGAGGGCGSLHQRPASKPAGVPRRHTPWARSGSQLLGSTHHNTFTQHH